MDIEQVARVVHEANRAFCKANGEAEHPAYDDAEKWMRDASVAGVKFRLENPDASDGAQHDQWMEEKINKGWTYGAVKDAEKKTHPMLVPYESLPESEKRKDRLFAAVVLALTQPLA